ncbi:MAG: hypothetical protein WC635_10575 [Bacteriovorax sp.]
MRPIIILSLLLTARAFSAEPAWWTQQKATCGISSSTAYNTWVANGSPCSKKSSGAVTTSPSPSGEIGKQIGTMIGQGIVNGIMGDKEEEARKAQAAAEKHRLENIKRAELERELEEQKRQDDNLKELSKQRLLGGLKGTESSLGGLQLKTDTVGSLKLKGEGDPEHLAKGRRVVDCQHTRELHDKLSNGLPAQRDMLKKYREQIDMSKKERAAISDDARTLAIKTAYDEARGIAKSLSAIRSRMKSMKLNGMSKAKRAAWMNALNASDSFYDHLDKLPTAATAGVKFGEDLPSIGKGLQERALRLNNLLVESGIAEQAGEELAKYGFGPVGALSFRVFKFGIESSYTMGKHLLNEEEIANAKVTYDNLEASYKRNEDFVNSVKSDLADFCSN